MLHNKRRDKIQARIYDQDSPVIFDEADLIETVAAGMRVAQIDRGFYHTDNLRQSHNHSESYPFDVSVDTY